MELNSFNEKDDIPILIERKEADVENIPKLAIVRKLSKIYVISKLSFKHCTGTYQNEIET